MYIMYSNLFYIKIKIAEDAIKFDVKQNSGLCMYTKMANPCTVLEIYIDEEK